MNEHSVPAIVKETKAGRRVAHSLTCRHGGEVVREQELPVRTVLLSQPRDVANCLVDDASTYANRLEVTHPGEGYALYRPIP